MSEVTYIEKMYRWLGLRLNATPGEYSGFIRISFGQDAWELDEFGKDPLKGEVIDGIRRAWPVGIVTAKIQTPRNLTPCRAWDETSFSKKNMWFLLDPPMMMYQTKPGVGYTVAC